MQGLGIGKKIENQPKSNPSLPKIKISILFYLQCIIFIGEYLKHHGVWCRPGQNMNATNVNDAKLECSANPECRMFDDKGGRGKRFTWCENTAETRKCPYGNVLYSKNNRNT